MEILVSSAVIAVAVIFSIVISRWLFSKISVNYISIFIGMAIALVPFLNRHVMEFDADFFMGIIIAPLLFFEGQHTRMNLVGRNLKLIISLTVGMVILCALAGGFAVAALFPIGLPLAFILAAISTPTDATATESVTNGLIVPRQQNTSLKLESLFNDASGIVLLNMALLWYVNGYINYGQTLWNFLYSAVGGVALGAIIAIILVFIRQAMLRSRMNFIGNTYNNGTPLKLMYLLTPYLIYYSAEACGVSGIIAVVFAGLIHNAEGERSELSNPVLAYDGNEIVRLINDTLNGAVFVILGIMLVRMIKNPAIHYGSLVWVGVGIALYVANLLIRYLYVRIVHHNSRRAAWIFSLGGIHGAVTFALAFTIAETQVHRQDFNLILMAESTLIILSMIVPTIAFRFILQPQKFNKDRASRIQELRDEMVGHAIHEIQQLSIPDEVKLAVSFDLRSQKGQTSLKEFWHEWTRMVRHEEFTEERINTALNTFRVAFRAERAFLLANYQRLGLSTADYNRLYRETMNAEMVVLDSYIN
ncbi:cation:proton antiporter [Limosilactobacillus sp.]|jgi:CPA1 family monovalent cation:H+ antiporter|uniref:cation:proton antiporter n=1 Tax=Limosilactobacillus sp. TaxID=2773925 RepID=UPI0025C382EB|nr:sodium:proton antiporter [Limosilactobacillus sp.]MCH3921866.1 sodium:proton antiporter [Limosilactobacillus sp.]MCH3928637.1 sodium:proton antiporter [Limosilactobacillus sp.]